jgi:hypothetical protein
VLIFFIAAPQLQIFDFAWQASWLAGCRWLDDLFFLGAWRLAAAGWTIFFFLGLAGWTVFFSWLAWLVGLWVS